MSGRMQKSLRNISAGILYQILSIASSFICRTAMVRFLGLDVISLHGLYWQVVSMLSLAELGIGSAIVYHLYQPLVEGDISRIKRIMALYRKCYNIIAAVCFLGGSIVTIFIPALVNGLPYSNAYLRIVFFLYVVQMSVSYLFVADTALLQADQKRYKTICIQGLFQVFLTAASLIVLYIWRNFILYLSVTAVFTLFMNIFCSIQAVHTYPYLKDRCVPLTLEESKPIFCNVRDIFVKKAAGYVTNSTDNICISLLAGTIQVGYYSNYAMLFNAVRTMEQQVANGFSASMGELAAKESPLKIDQTLRTMTIYLQLFAMVMSAGLMACSSTFVTIWIGRQYRLPVQVIFICCVNTYLSIVKDPLWQTMDACGLFSYDRNLAIISTFINLTVSVLLGIQYGMAGIFIGTAVSTVFEIIFKAAGIYQKKLLVSSARYRITWGKMAVSETAVLFAACRISKVSVSNPYITFLFQGCVAVIAAVLLWGISFPSQRRDAVWKLKQSRRLSFQISNKKLPFFQNSYILKTKRKNNHE